MTLVLLGEDLFRLGAGSLNFLPKMMIIQPFFLERKFVSQVGLGVAELFMSLSMELQDNTK
jgi:hypothetical protein